MDQASEKLQELEDKIGMLSARVDLVVDQLASLERRLIQSSVREERDDDEPLTLHTKQGEVKL